MAEQNALGSLSPLFLSYREEILEAQQVLDLACGRGRHALDAATGRALVVGLDRNRTHLRELSASAKTRQVDHNLLLICADLETESEQALRGGNWDVILVFRYLHRPLCHWIEQALRPGGLLLYETFTEGQLKLGGGPKNPSFLLTEGELPKLFRCLKTEQFEETIIPERHQALASLAARRHPES